LLSFAAEATAVVKRRTVALETFIVRLPMVIMQQLVVYMAKETANLIVYSTKYMHIYTTDIGSKGGCSHLSSKVLYMAEY
jgi:hypothetical protein